MAILVIDVYLLQIYSWGSGSRWCFDGSGVVKLQLEHVHCIFFGKCLSLSKSTRQHLADHNKYSRYDIIYGIAKFLC